MGSFQPKLMTKIKVISQKPSKNWIFGKNDHFLTIFGQKIPNFEFSPPGGSKRGENEFLGKSENVMFLHSLRLSFMQKIRKIYRAVFREKRGRETDRQTERERERQRRTRI